jgi:hypothetical protein
MIRPAIYGSVLWFGAAVFINKAEVLYRPDTSLSTTLFLYIASIPVAYIGINAMPHLSVCKRSEIQRSTLIGLAAATMLDGLAMVFSPSLYGASVNNVRGAAWLLWGVGWFCLFSL